MKPEIDDVTGKVVSPVQRVPVSVRGDNIPTKLIRSLLHLQFISSEQLAVT